MTKEKEDMTKEKEDMTNGKEDMTKKKDKNELATPGWRVTEPPEDSGLLQQGRVMRSATAGVEDTSDWHYRVMHGIMERRAREGEQGGGSTGQGHGAGGGGAAAPNSQKASYIAAL